MSDPWDPAAAAKLLDAHVLVGITYVDANEQFLERRQFHGTVEAVDEEKGVTIRLHGSEKRMQLPPELSAFKPATPGEYQLAASGEFVSNPDYVALWTHRRPPSLH
jgi:hypothetical protein